MTFIAGPFTATYTPALGSTGALSLGITEDGFELEEIYYSEQIKGDNLGDSVQDEVDRGKDVFINAVFEEADLSAIARMINPKMNLNSPNFLGYQGAIGQVGVLHQNRAGILILTAVSGTTAGVGDGTVCSTLTANKAMIVPNYSLRRALASRLRKIPVRLRLLPYVSSQVTYHYIMA